MVSNPQLSRNHEHPHELLGLVRNRRLLAEEALEILRGRGTAALDPARRAELGQFFTPPAVAKLMSSMFRTSAEPANILDPGAGSGSLFSAVVLDFARRNLAPSELHVTAYEIEPAVLPELRIAGAISAEVAATAGIRFSLTIEEQDFVADAVRNVRGGFFQPTIQPFSHAILNPPYGKVASTSRTRRLLRRIGVEAGNSYVAFLALAVELLEPEGELVAITPRSFCNGPYFRDFRRWLIDRMAIDRVHVFNSRSAAFRSDDVLQENVIFHAIRSSVKPPTVTLTTSTGDGEGVDTTRTVSYSQFIRPDDPDSFIHIVTDDWGARVAGVMGRFGHSLEDLGLGVSTGRVVDFRVRERLRANPSADTVPLIYPAHFRDGYVCWPQLGGRKPNGLVVSGLRDPLALQAGRMCWCDDFRPKRKPADSSLLFISLNLSRLALSPSKIT